MANLAIKGHATRSEEVIQLLEMLGGKNIHRHDGKSSEFVYVINSSYKGEIDCFYAVSDVYKVYTLEQFLEKFPYKIGDKVTDHTNSGMMIVRMYWDSQDDIVRYELKSGAHVLTGFSVEQLRPYTEQEPLVFKENFYDSPCTGRVKTEETMEKIMEIDDKLKPVIDLTKYCKDEYLVELGDYEYVLKDGKTYFIKKQPQYPKTYEECCDVLVLNTMDNDAQGYKADLIICFQELLIARDAYWKTVGERMGLGEPWKPDWEDGRPKYGLIVSGNRVKKQKSEYVQMKFCFPTEEILDAFCENFDKSINNCKEML